MFFVNRDFPRNIAAGSSAIVERRVDVVTLSSGHEHTNARWKHSRRRYQVGLGIRTADDLSEVIDLWEEVGGPEGVFRFRDWSDFKSCAPSQMPAPADQFLGSGDGQNRVFQLRKIYGNTRLYARAVSLPLPNSIRIAINGIEIDSNHWTCDVLSGRVTFDQAPAADALITAGFAFDIPVRFLEQALELDMAYFQDEGGIGSMPDIVLIERRLDGSLPEMPLRPVSSDTALSDRDVFATTRGEAFSASFSDEFGDTPLDEIGVPLVYSIPHLHFPV